MSEQRAIWKYKLEDPLDPIDLPAGAEVVHAGLDPERHPCIWVLVDTGPSVPTQRRWFDIVATGEGFASGAEHIATFMPPPVGKGFPAYVWHVVETTRVAVEA